LLDARRRVGFVDWTSRTGGHGVRPIQVILTVTALPRRLSGLSRLSELSRLSGLSGLSGQNDFFETSWGEIELLQSGLEVVECVVYGVSFVNDI
jgi:hypothetical protein